MKNLKFFRHSFAGLTLISMLGLTSCVSVNIGPKPGERSKNVTFQSPSTPYVVMKDASADGAWLNKANGDSISYFSTCNDPSDPPLDSVARDLFSGLSELKIVNQSEPSYNGREALRMDAQGRVDGVPTRISTLVFKKNDCTYTLSHVGVSKTFDQDQATFETFLKSFKAP